MGPLYPLSIAKIVVARQGMLQVEFMPQNLYVEVLTPVPQNVTVFGDRIFTEIIKLK